MKIFEVVIFILAIVSVIYCENVEKNPKEESSEEVLLRHKEYHRFGKRIEEKSKDFNNQFDNKPKTKKYQTNKPKEVQFVIVKRTQEPPIKKYVVAKSSSEFTTHHNSHPTKISYNIAHKPKPKVVKIVQDGPVKHIYLDMPDMVEDSAPKAKLPKEESLQVPVFESTKQFGSNFHYNYGKEQNFASPVRYANVVPVVHEDFDLQNNFGGILKLPQEVLPKAPVFESIKYAPSNLQYNYEKEQNFYNPIMYTKVHPAVHENFGFQHDFGTAIKLPKEESPKGPIYESMNVYYNYGKGQNLDTSVSITEGLPAVHEDSGLQNGFKTISILPKKELPKVSISEPVKQVTSNLQYNYGKQQNLDNPVSYTNILPVVHENLGVKLPKEDTPKVPVYEPVKQVISNIQYNYEKEQNLNTPVRYTNVFPVSNKNFGLQNNFGTVSSGYSVEKPEDIKPLMQSYAPQYLRGFENNLYSLSSGPQTFSKSQTIKTSTYLNPSHQYGFSHPQYLPINTGVKETINYGIPQEYKHIFDQNVQQDFTPNALNFSPNQEIYNTEQVKNNTTSFNKGILNIVKESKNSKQLNHNLQNNNNFEITPVVNQETSQLYQPVFSQNDFINHHNHPQDFIPSPSSFSSNNQEQPQQTVNSSSGISSQQQAYSYEQYPQFNKYSVEDSQGYKHVFKTNAYNVEHEFVPSSSENKQVFDFNTNKANNTTDFETEVTKIFNNTKESAQITSNQQNEYLQQQLAQFSSDNSEEFKPVYSYNQNPQSFVSPVTNFASSPQQISNEKTARMSTITGFESDLVKMVSDALNSGEGYTTHDGFKVIKSPNEKAIYLVGKPGMSLDTIPDLSAYSFGNTEQSYQI